MTTSVPRRSSVGFVVAIYALVVLAIDPANRTVVAQSVEGTEWSMSGEGPQKWEITYRFEPGGVLFCKYSGQEHRNGTWKQDGDELYFENNKGYRQCRAIIRGDRIDGESWNVKGLRWKTELTPATGGK